MKVLLTGANGQLGRCIQDRTPEGVELIALTRAELDISDQVSVMSLCEKLKPNFIINAAAYTAVDKAESNPEAARAINTIGPENLAYAAAKSDIPIIHVSTDYVFDGTAITPYTPNCPTSPQSVYGQTKLDGENSIKAITSKHVIIRTAWVFSEYGNNFVKTMLRLGAERDELGIVADQIGCPTYAGDLAKCIFNFITLIKNNAKTVYGIYHFCGDEQVSWYEFANAIFDEAKTKKVIVNKPLLKKLTTSEYPTPAKRPKYSVMKDTSPHTSFSDWRTALKNTI
jgi:dTDP-4-dehydrorhamnose reductase